MLLVLATLLAASSAVRPFSEERDLLSRRLETLRRILPDAPNPLADTAVVRGLADEARLSGVEVLARPPLEAGSRGDVLLDVSGVGRFADVDRFFRQAALSHRLIDVESVTLAATPADLVRLTAVVRLPYRPARAPLPAPPDGTRSRLNGVARSVADAFVRDQALALAKSEMIASLRRSRRNPRLFFAELAAIARDRPVVLHHAAIGEEFVVRGLAVGEGPVRALERRFERGFFRISEFLMARQGACHRFEVRGHSPVAGPDAELPLPVEDPFEQDDAPCRVDRDQSRGVLVRGPNSKTPRKGPLTIRLRDVDLADVFQVLHRLTSQGFLVDGDVAGRASVELSRVTPEEALAALEKQAGLRISGPAPIRRVSLARGAGPSPPLGAAGGTPTASFTLKRAEVRDILAVMTDADASLAALGPQGFLGRASVWVSALPLADLRAALLTAAGLSERIEEGRRLLEHNPGADEPLVPMAATPPPQRRLVLQARDLAVLEFELVGLASAGDDWTALVYSPTGALSAYKAGDRLADGSVTSVQSTDALLETSEGPLRVPLAPPPR